MISIENITFEYRKHKPVLEDFSLDFQQGGIYGLLGKNGTGKSTLLYLMCGLLTPQKGHVFVDGILPGKRLTETMGEMFLVPEEYDLPSISLHRYTEALKPFYPHFSEELLEKCLDAFEMPHDLNLGALSMGQKKKVYISIALATNTRYLLMDEPTNGLDILAKSQFRKAVIGSTSEEKTIILSTHQVHDVEHLLEHVCIIEKNCVLLQQSLVEEENPIDLEQLFIKAVEAGRAVKVNS